MEETVDELVSKHTRRELEEMALQTGVESLGGTKAQLAEMILEVKRAAKVEKSPPEETPAEALEAAPKEAPKAAPKVTTKEARKEVIAGKHGVHAKSLAITSMGAELQAAGMAIREEGIAEMTKSVSAFRKDTDSQIAENKTAVANIHSSVRQMQSSSDRMSKEFRKAGQDIRDNGTREMRKAISRFNDQVKAQMGANEDAAQRMQAEAGDLRAAMDKKSRGMQKAGKDLRDQGIREMRRAVGQFNKDLDGQIKGNRESVSRMHSGAGEIRSSMDKMSRNFQKAGKDLREQGAREMQKGLAQFKRDLDRQIRDNRDAAAKMDAGVRDLQSASQGFQQGILDYCQGDLRKYVNDFYYG